MINQCQSECKRFLFLPGFQHDVEQKHEGQHCACEVGIARSDYESVQHLGLLCIFKAPRVGIKVDKTNQVDTGSMVDDCHEKIFSMKSLA